ncbi:hypothetical protein [Amycolatopsis sp. NPDC004378]
MTGRDDPEGRAAFRAFVRAHHPDVGGDPDVFAEGVARFRAGSDGDSRFDAPITFVARRRRRRFFARFRRRAPRVR